MEFTNLVTSVDPYTGSAATSRFAMCPFLGINPQETAISFQSSAFSLFVPELLTFGSRIACPTATLVQNTRARRAYFAAPPLARLVPYFDRLCERPATPTESS